MRDIMTAYCTDMDGGEIHKGDRALCLALPERQPVLVRITEILEGGRVKADNGQITAIVPGESCILQTACGR